MSTVRSDRDFWVIHCQLSGDKEPIFLAIIDIDISVDFTKKGFKSPERKRAVARTLMFSKVQAKAAEANTTWLSFNVTLAALNHSVLQHETAESLRSPGSFLY
jgi:hypothetical protein